LSQDTLFDKVWDLHKVSSLPGGSDQIFIGLHLIHEVTSPQAFGALRDKNLKVKFPERTVATVDHIVPTDNQSRPFKDNLAEQMIETLEKNCLEHKIKFFNIGSGNQGIVHVVAPELGLTQPGMTIACGDSHTSTHGAFGSIAFGIGTSQVRDVLATQTIAMNKLKVRQIWCENQLSNGVYAKDLVLHIINKLGVKAGVGFAYEFAGPAINALSMEERMTICNMSIEGGARCGYINPDEKTFSYIKNKLCAPKNEHWENALTWWKTLKSDENSIYDDVIKIDAAKIEPTVTWGITPGQSIGINQQIPLLDELSPNDKLVAEEAFEYMSFKQGQSIKDIPVEVDFITVSSYGSEMFSSGNVKILKDLDGDINGHDVLLVEDIVDTGKTLEAVIEMLETRVPNSIKVCALLNKQSRRISDIKADWIGFEIPDEFVVGYGIDYDQRNRNLPYIGKVVK